MLKKYLVFIFVFVLAFFISPKSVFASSGAIFTTNVDCTGTNVNIFDAKTEVYLDGGPHHIGSAGLPDGNYFVKVTDPSGANVLGESSTADVSVTGGSFATCYQLASIVNSFSSGFVSPGFDDTTNGGGVYKVWVSTDSDFANSTNKTDNFKVKSSPIENGRISGLKWQDDDANGFRDPGEPKLSDWTIELWNADHTGSTITTTTTDPSGFYDFNNVIPGTYQVCEVIQNGWHATYPNISDTENCNTTVVVESKKTTKDVDFGNYQNASLTVIKHVINDNGGEKVAGNFTMLVNGISPSNDSFPGNENGTTITIKPGDYIVTESGPSGYTETDSSECSGVATSGEQITCTITNSDQPAHITLTKIVNNNHGGQAGPNDFGISIDNNVVISGSTTDVSANSVHSINETGLPNYKFDSISGDEKCPSVLGGEVTLTEGESLTCTITNSDIAPSLTLIKTVINDNGGTKQVSDFPLFVNQTLVVSGEAKSFEPGNYIATETNSFGYSASVWGGDCATDGSVTLSFGDKKTCTITNDDIAPKLTVIKHVVNDNGGSKVAGDFTMNVTGTNVSNASFAGSELGTQVTLDAGTYSVDENLVSTYAKSLGANCSGTIAVGEEKSCTITNDDIAPHLIVIKNVNNQVQGAFVNNIPSDFTMIINGVTASDGNTFPGSSNGVDKTLTSVGTFNVTESGPGGYTASFVGCSGTIGLGETKTCTITNTAQPGRMTGGGSILSANTKITHGFELHCNLNTLPNNLEINWNDKSGKAHKFHLNNLNSVTCSKIGNPAPPKNTANGFNSLTGIGTGILDDKSIGSINFTFTDFGEPGKNDTASYVIVGGGGLVANGSLQQGNHQAHIF